MRGTGKGETPGGVVADRKSSGGGKQGGERDIQGGGRNGEKNRNIAQYFATGKARRDGNREFIVDHSTESEKFRSAYLVCLPGFEYQETCMNF